MRAKILYALFPADANKFKHLMDPLATFILFTALFGLLFSFTLLVPLLMVPGPDEP